MEIRVSEIIKDFSNASDSEITTLQTALNNEIEKRIVTIKDDMIEFNIDRAAKMFNFEIFSESQLALMFENMVKTMNKKKAERRGVDAGFWDSVGNYKEDVQPVSKEEFPEIYGDVSLWLSLVFASEIQKKLNEIDDIAKAGLFTYHEMKNRYLWIIHTVQKIAKQEDLREVLNLCNEIFEKEAIPGTLVLDSVNSCLNDYSNCELKNNKTLSFNEGDHRQGGEVLSFVNYSPSSGNYWNAVKTKLNEIKKDDPEYFARILEMLKKHYLYEVYNAVCEFE